MNNNLTYVPQMASIADRVNKPARLVQAIQMHNEEMFAEAVMLSIYDQVDRIIVIEGAVQNRPNATEDGHSTDDTLSIIQRVIQERDPDNKITLISIDRPWKHLEEMKQAFLHACFPGDWIIINDADEFYMPEDIDRVRQAIDLNPHACEFVPTFLHFYGDCSRVAVPGPEWQPSHQRVFKYTRGMKYNSHPVVTDADGACTYFSPHYQSRRVMLRKPFFIYHYGYARPNMDRVMQEKQEYYKGELAKHGGADKKFDQKVNDWMDHSEPTLIYDGGHPRAVPDVILSQDRKRGEDVGTWMENSFYHQVIARQDYGNIWLCMSKQSQPFMSHYHNAMDI